MFVPGRPQPDGPDVPPVQPPVITTHHGAAGTLYGCTIEGVPGRLAISINLFNPAEAKGAAYLLTEAFSRWVIEDIKTKK